MVGLALSRLTHSGLEEQTGLQLKRWGWCYCDRHTGRRSWQRPTSYSLQNSYLSGPSPPRHSAASLKSHIERWSDKQQLIWHTLCSIYIQNLIMNEYFIFTHQTEPAASPELSTTRPNSFRFLWDSPTNSVALCSALVWSTEMLDVCYNHEGDRSNWYWKTQGVTVVSDDTHWVHHGQLGWIGLTGEVDLHPSNGVLHRGCSHLSLFLPFNKTKLMKNKHISNEPVAYNSNNSRWHVEMNRHAVWGASGTPHG